MIDRFVKTKTVLAELNCSEYERKQFVELGILEAPIRLAGKAPRHTERQIERAKRAIAAFSLKTPTARSARIKPIRESILGSIKNKRG